MEGSQVDDASFLCAPPSPILPPSIIQSLHVYIALFVPIVKISVLVREGSTYPYWPWRIGRTVQKRKSDKGSKKSRPG